MGNNTSNPSSRIPSLSRLNITRLNDDVYELHKPSSGPINIQIVFFHGFQVEDSEDAYIRTWMKRDGSGCWINTWLVECFPQAHILSVSYDSSIETSARSGRLDMFLIGENLTRSLIDLVGVGQTCPVVLVGHCVGGLVLKEICLRASQLGILQEDRALTRNRYQQFLTYVRGAFFYSTAHSGSHMTLSLNEDLRGPLLSFMELLNKHSGRISSEFTQLRGRYGWKTFGLNEANETSTLTVMISSFNEIYMINFKTVRQDQEMSSTSGSLAIVPEASAWHDADCFVTIRDTDHFTVSKPMDEKSDNFLFLVNFLKTITVEDEVVSLTSSSGVKIKGIPESLQQLEALRVLQIYDCENFEGLFASLGHFRSLRNLILGYCKNFKALNEAFWQLPSLQVLTIENFDTLKVLPKSLGQLRALKKLEVYNCHSLEGLPESLRQLSNLKVLTYM